MKNLWRAYIAVVACVALGTAWFAASSPYASMSAGTVAATAVPLAGTTHQQPAQHVVQDVTPTVRRTTTAVMQDPATPVAQDRDFRDADRVIAGFPRHTSTDDGLASVTAVAAVVTATDTLTMTEKPPVMSPEEIAAAEATIRDGQARMSRARTQFRLSVIADAEKEVTKTTKNLEKVRADNTKQEDVATAETNLQTAQADFERVRLENVSLVNVEQAEADVRAAQARLETAQTQSAADPAARAAAQDRLAVAQQQYGVVVNDAAARRSVAEQAMNDQAGAVQTLQQNVATSAAQNEQAQQGIDPVSGQPFADVGMDAVTQQQNYALALAAAQANLADGQVRLDQAVVAVDAARQQEVTDVAAAQAVVDQAQNDLGLLPQGPDPAAIAQAQQDLDAARAKLADVQQIAPAVVEAQQRVETAQTDLDRIKGEWAKAEPLIAKAQKELDDAQAALKLARQRAVGKVGWTWPTYGTLSSGFGKRSLTENSNHNGIDIANATNTPIAAARAGTVTEAGWCKGYGFCVKIAHGGGLTSEYGHMAAMPFVKAVDEVQAGTIVGLMGTTYDQEHGGYSTGVHLHLTIRRNGVAVDPLTLLP